MTPIHSSRLRCLVCAVLATACVLRVGWAGEFPDELVRFRNYERNPVFGGAGPGHWDVKIRERGWIIRDEDGWRLWYTGYDGTPTGGRYLGYATSPDGLVWSRSAKNPLDAHSYIEDMQVVRHGDRWLMFAEGPGDRAQWLSSHDGMNWQREGRLDVRKVDSTPISEGAYGTPCVWFENGVWSLFYERGDLGVWLARSTDLKVWTNVQDEPVLALGPESYDRVQIALNQIIRHEGKYYAYFHGSGTVGKPRLWTSNIAVSTDLVRWKKYAGNPLLPESENKSSPMVVFDGKQFRLYTTHEKVDVHFAGP